MYKKNEIMRITILIVIGFVIVNNCFQNMKVLDIRPLNSVHQDYKYARDLIERAPIYLTMKTEKGADWIIEKSVYEDYEFSDFELKAFMGAKSVKKIAGNLSSVCKNEINKEVMQSIDIGVLKGNKEIGYSSLRGKFLYQENELPIGMNIYVGRCSRENIYILSLK
jgi:hypothetical protein